MLLKTYNQKLKTMYNLKSKPKTYYQIIAEAFLIVFMTAILFFIATSCTSIRIKNKNIYPCCNKQVCELRRVLLINGSFHVYHNDGTGYTFIGKLKTNE